MRWALVTGDAYRALLAAGQPIPLEFAPPTILDGFGGWYEDFWDLSTERQIGMGIGPIPASAIERHTQGWNYADADMFRACIRAMDRLYLETAGNPDGPKSTEPEEPVSARDAFRGAFGGRAKRG